VRSRYGYLFGGALVLIAVAIIVIAFTTAVSTIEGMQRVAMPGRAELVLPIGPSTLYIEGDSKIGDRVIANGHSVDVVDCELESPPGVGNVELMRPNASVSYTAGGYRGHNGFDVNVATGGTYQLTCKSAEVSEFAVAVGAGIGSWMVIAVLAFIPGVAGIVLLVVTIVRRYRAARRIAEAR
jgi:hypothetical protein